MERKTYMIEIASLSEQEIDSLVAEKVLGWIKPPATSVLKPMWVEPHLGTVHPELPKFSTNIADAWRVMEVMKDSWTDLSLSRDGGHWNLCWGFDGYGWPDVSATTAPLAICLGALKSIEIVI